MLRKWFCLASVFAVGVLLVAADAGQGRERRMFRGRNRGNTYDNYTYYIGQVDYTQSPAADTGGGVRQAFYPPETPSQSTRQMPVFLDVRIPANAEITIEGQKTTQMGPRRLFVSPPLAPGQDYTYEIKAKWTENGKEVTRSRTIGVRPGMRLVVDLTAPSPPINRQ